MVPFVVILNSPPHMGIHRVQRRLAERLDVSWERIDPFCQLDDHRHLFEEDVASGFDEGAAAIEGAVQQQRSVIMEFRLTELTYDRLASTFEGRGYKLILVTIAPPRALAMSCPNGIELTAKKRMQIRRFFERGCHLHSAGIIMSARAEDPDVMTTSIIERFRDQNLLP